MRDYIDWVRYWGPADSEPALDEDGFLISPNAELSRIRDPDLRTLGDDGLRHAPCLILIGSGGEGKTTEVRRLLAPESNPLKSPDPPNYINLGKIGSEASFHRKLEAWGAAASDSGQGDVLVLDGFDECWDTLRSLVFELADILNDLGVRDLKVRIAARPGPWVEQLEASIPALWPDEAEAVKTLHLLPLTRHDVLLAAKESGVREPDTFLKQVVSMGLAGLATKPIGVRFLIESYRQTGTLGENRYKLFLDGCFALAAEQDRHRAEDRRHGYLEPMQRLAVAARIAALTALGGRHIITDPEPSIPSDGGELTIADLAGGNESVKGVDFGVSESAVREVVRNASLFDSSAADRFAWVHRSFEEFLAAHWLCERGFANRQFENLLTTSVSGVRRLYPDLAGVAGWVASRRSDFFDLVAEADPEALMDSDAGMASDEHRERLTKLILARIAERPARGEGWEWYRRYSKLRHPRMAETLRAVLAAQGTPVEVCRTAILMARACRVVDLAKDLLGIALDPEGNLRIRWTAAAGVADLGDRQCRLKLRALLDLPPHDDPDDEFRGIALAAMRKAGLPAAEILPYLRPPAREFVISAYTHFLGHDFPASLKAEEVGLALQWLDKTAVNFSILQVGHLAEEVGAAAWGHLGSVSDDVRQHLASLVLRRDEAAYRMADSLSNRLERLTKGDAVRRCLLLEAAAAVAGKMEAPEGTVPWVSDFPGARDESLGWFIEKARAASTDDQVGWVSLMRLAADPSDPRQREALIEARSAVPALAREYGDRLEPGGWERAEARWATEAPRRQTWPGLATELVEDLLNNARDGQRDAWLLLNRQLWRDPDSGGPQWPSSEVCRAPGWQQLPEALQDELQDGLRTACDTYLMGGLPSVADWIGSSKIPYHAAIEYWSLRWVTEQNPDLLATLPAEDLESWAALTSAFWGPGLTGDDGEEGHLDLVDRFMELAPDAYLSVVLDRMRVQIEDHGAVFAHEQLQRHYRDRAGPALLDFIADPAMDLHPFATVAFALLGAGYDPARELLVEFFHGYKPGGDDGTSRRRAVLAARLLLEHGANIWPEVWAALSRDQDFGELILEELRTGLDLWTERILEPLGAEELADLFTWLESRRKAAEDSGGHGPGPGAAWSELRELRGTVLSLLGRRRTRESVQALERLREAFPDLPWLDRHVIRAERNAAAGDWVPVAPGDLLSMARDSHRYVVRSEADLFEIVIEALGHYGRDLHGRRHLVRHLWNDNPVLRPKTEAALSDEVTDYLRQTLCEKGTIINREVQIRPHPKGTGDRTDLLVSAVARDPRGVAEVASVVIEVKGCWHEELSTAMEAQLAARYLRAASFRYGIYLVGWFSAPDWEDTDPRKRKCGRGDAKAMQARLENQAKELSRDGLEIRAIVLDATYNLGQALKP